MATQTQNSGKTGNSQAPAPDKPKKEAKDVAFKRLFRRRWPKVVKAVAAIANLGNRANYLYTEDEVKKLFAGLDKLIANTKIAFSATVKAEETDTLGI